MKINDIVKAGEGARWALGARKHYGRLVRAEQNSYSPDGVVWDARVPDDKGAHHPAGVTQSDYWHHLELVEGVTYAEAHELAYDGMLGDDRRFTFDRAVEAAIARRADRGVDQVVAPGSPATLHDDDVLYVIKDAEPPKPPAAAVTKRGTGTKGGVTLQDVVDFAAMASDAGHTRADARVYGLLRPVFASNPRLVGLTIDAEAAR